jgi:xanthine dehydrogenase accessory factor
MSKQLLVWNLIAESLHENIPVMLLYVLESKGSSPGRQGFFMAVNAGGKMQGSIGGGIMEHKFVELAKERMQETSFKAQVKKQVHDKSAAKNQSGMICSGEQTVLLYPVQQKDQDAMGKIISSLQQNKNGTLTLSPNGIDFSEAIPEKDFHLGIKSEADWIYKEKTGYKNHLFIIGGGHCSLAFSKLMSTMDFYIHLFEEREGLHTMMQNDFVHQKITVNNYNELADLIPSGNHNYIVIMTFGYRSDSIALRALLNKQFKYFGLLGSQKKIEKMFEDLKKEGIAKEELQKIHSPIGINIKSQTPEEIAISIAAEIIKVKNT